MGFRRLVLELAGLRRMWRQGDTGKGSYKTLGNVTDVWQGHQNVILALHNEYLGKKYLKIMKLLILHLAKAYEIFK